MVEDRVLGHMERLIKKVSMGMVTQEAVSEEEDPTIEVDLVEETWSLSDATTAIK